MDGTVRPVMVYTSFGTEGINVTKAQQSIFWALLPLYSEGDMEDLRG